MHLLQRAGIDTRQQDRVGRPSQHPHSDRCDRSIMHVRDHQHDDGCRARPMPLIARIGDHQAIPMEDGGGVIERDDLRVANRGHDPDPDVRVAFKDLLEPHLHRGLPAGRRTRLHDRRIRSPALLVG